MNQDTITLKNVAPPEKDRGINLTSKHCADSVYFCDWGLKAVLGTDQIKEVQISTQPFKGSMQVDMHGYYFFSKLGQYKGCTDHPKCLMELMGRKPKAPHKLRFYVKIS
jgi:hypothetical protein